MIYSIIMAGGAGTRFWPYSTPEKPKQLLNLFLDKTMIQLTLDRVKQLSDIDHIKIVTVEEQIARFHETVPSLKDTNFYVEPMARNTAPCIGLAATYLLEEDEDAIMIVLPADHLIKDEKKFQKCLKLAVEDVKNNDTIVTLGIKPTRPETGYGYIQFDSKPISDKMHSVVTFAEKPSLDIAQQFLETGEFLWNSGIFVWSAKRIMAEIEEHLPALYAALIGIKKSLGKNDEASRIDGLYRSIKPISIDYGIMEKAKNIRVVLGDFDWSDVGSWEEVYQLTDKDNSNNAIKGPVVAVNCNNNLLVSEDSHPLAVHGLSNMIVVNSEDGTLVIPRSEVQEVRTLAEQIFKMLNNSSGK